MKTNRQTKIWILLFILLLCLGALGLVFARSFSSPAVTARISVDGECVKVIDLRAVTLPYEFEISTAHGRNLVRVEHGRIAVIESDCPEQICVRQGYVQESGVPIVCLPHRLVIELEGDE